MNINIRNLGAACMATIFLAACSSTPQSTGANQSPGPTSSPTGSPAAASSLQGPGLMVLTCENVNSGYNNGQFMLSLIDPQTGRTIAKSHTVSLAQTAGVLSPNLYNLCGSSQLGPQPLALREHFDSMYSRVVATTAGSNGGHIGFVDLKTGMVTDLTTPRVPSGFGRSPQESYPVFEPGTDRLWYLSRDVNLKTTAFAEDITTGTTQPADLTSAPWIRQVGVCSAMGCQPIGLLSPTDKVSVFGGYLFKGPSWSNTDRLLLPGCTPYAWVDDSRLLCAHNGNIALVTFSASYGSYTLTDLLPPSDLANIWPVIAPDRNEFAFLSTSGAIYRTTLTPGATPTKVADLGITSLPVLLEWK